MAGNTRRGAIVAVLLVLAVSACSRTSAAPPDAAQEAYLAQIHDADAAVNQYRTDTELLRLGAAACGGFENGESFQALADRLAADVGTLPTADLGSLIVSAAEHLCPDQRRKVT